MQKLLSLILITSFMTCIFCGCHSHTFSYATCTEPQVCNECGATQGEALDHIFSNATCDTPSSCYRCNATRGEALGHEYENHVCTRCKEISPNTVSVNLNKTLLGYCQNYNGEDSQIVFNKDYGNRYPSNFHLYRVYDNIYSSEAYSTHQLNGEYDVFSGKIISTKYCSNSVTIKFIADDKEIYRYSGYCDPWNHFNESFTVDVRNFKNLEIYVTAPMYSHNLVAIVDAKLLK